MFLSFTLTRWWTKAGGKRALSSTDKSLPVYALPPILQIYDIFATAGKCRENNRHSVQWVDEIKIPVIFQSLRVYDSHFIMREVGEVAKKFTYKKKKVKANRWTLRQFQIICKNTRPSCRASIPLFLIASSSWAQVLID